MWLLKCFNKEEPLCKRHGTIEIVLCMEVVLVRCEGSTVMMMSTELLCVMTLYQYIEVLFLDNCRMYIVW